MKLTSSSNKAYFKGEWSLLQWQMKPITMADETYCNGRWNLLQWPMKSIAMTNEACFDRKLSIFAIYYDRNREGWSRNREGCVMDKSPFSCIYHAEYSLYINTLKAFFQKIVMGDRWFAKNIFIRRKQEQPPLGASKKDLRQARKQERPPLGVPADLKSAVKKGSTY